MKHTLGNSDLSKYFVSRQNIITAGAITQTNDIAL